MQPYQKFSIDSLFELEDFEKPKIIWRTKPTEREGIRDPQDENLIQIAGNAINVVAARNIRSNIDRSVRMALELAASGSRVLYLNSYAGADMLRDTIYSYLPQVAEESKPIRDRVSILAFPYGMMGRSLSVAKNAIYEGEKIESEENPLINQLCDVVILNSFEFATFDYRDKVTLASAMLEWAQVVPITLVVFTQELRMSMWAGVPTRGPLGLLTSAAATVSKIGRTARERMLMGQIDNEE
ncbi:MAG TPA: hypothetical protein VGM92_09395 [Candidatus Kapabacteria bacterium]|jgi:hypothetical protein